MAQPPQTENPITDSEAPSQFPDDRTTFLLPGPVGQIECLTDVPELDDPMGVAVICHPHPLGGGTMHNKVVTIVERSLRELGLATVRFNFRGVGDSEGEHDEGFGETDDLLAVVEWVRKTSPALPLSLAGFSFGSYIALKAAAGLDLRQLISIAPPVDRYDFGEIEHPGCPWLVVQGDEDEVVDPDSVYAWAETLEPPPALEVMDKTGHFFHRRLMDLRGLIKNGVRDNLTPAVDT